MASPIALKKSNCKNCYKCIRHCPVKSIKFSGNQAHILDDDCVLCGQCFVVCPQNAKQIVSEIEKVEVFIKGGEKVIASLAPSFIANYENSGIDAMKKALKKLGFYDAEETAIGATVVKKEYEKMINEENRDVVISTCCHSVNLLIQKHFPELLPYVADVVSPMQAHAIDIKRRHKDAKVVFIGPCVAKKDEANKYEGLVDAVLTFEELTSLFKDENIVLEKETDSLDESRARFFPTTGGILKTMQNRRLDYTYVAIDGTDNCIAALKDIKNGNIHKCFIEMSMCTGSCIGGPVMEKYHRSPVRDFSSIAKYAGTKDFSVEEYNTADLKKRFNPLYDNLAQPTDDDISKILKQMGKISKMDELNCGSCGYNTCREKAIAIFQGKADISMCLPFLKDKAEKFSNNIFDNTPNGLIVLNEDFEVQQINYAARKILNIRDQKDVLGDNIGRIIDPQPFIETTTMYKGIKDKKMYLAEYDKYIELNTIFDREYHTIYGIMRDVTDIEKEKEKKDIIGKQTLDTADKVIEKQMRIVQEIASLLGETAAETKIALSKLKESIENE